MGGWLNPLNLIKLLGGLKTLFEVLKEMLSLIQLEVGKREAQKKKDAVDKAASDLKQANGVKDDKARIKAKAQAACRLEKLANPDSDCDNTIPR